MTQDIIADDASTEDFIGFRFRDANDDDWVIWGMSESLYGGEPQAELLPIRDSGRPQHANKRTVSLRSLFRRKERGDWEIVGNLDADEAYSRWGK